MESTAQGSEKAKRKCLTLQQKVEILNVLEQQTHTKAELARLYSVDRATIRKIELQQKGILELVSTGCTSNFHRKKYVTKNSDLEQALYDWYIELRYRNEVVTTGRILAKAHKLAAELGIASELKCSEKWIRNFKKRYDLNQQEAELESYEIYTELPSGTGHDATMGDDFTVENTIKQEVTDDQIYSGNLYRCQHVVQCLTDVIGWAEDVGLEFDDIANLQKIKAKALEKCKSFE
ncbi:tigger transposable element-derived protein 4 [Malaya genurostris]|uniref:tigger transposable element-derived protein 4 n=1 Tax=Malaya genurostris TaxID=325434 RepID=UPI0026F39EAB|nr:tigger transposable element-derived protein 4 [Malaya genurostris]